MFEVRTGELVAQLGGELLGNAELVLRRISPLDGAAADAISFLASARHQALLHSSAAGCVIVAPVLRDAVAARASAIVSADPYLYYARLTQWWVRHARAVIAPGVHPSAVVEPGAMVHASACVGALAFVGSGAHIGQGAVVGPQSHVGAHAMVGEGTRLAAMVVVGAGCRIGARAIVHSGAVIGADGFGFAPVEGRWEKIEQLGAVDIGDDVEIGANTCIDRGALHDTVLEQGVKLDNLVHIAHNVFVGAHTAMAACVGIAGSTRIGAHCTFAGQAGVVGHVQICDHVHVGAACAVTRSIHKPGSYGGLFPFDENGVWDKNAATLRQ
ncbi:MAG: UDP-3-O-(3-hydroxymyristoyl)glucosamine N-acyltransferase, partial [Rubrivivax sp.]